MNILLDAHTLIWAVDDPERLGPRARAAIEDPGNDLLLGAGTVWEISIKAGLGKLTLSLPFREWMNGAMTRLRASLLPITLEHCAAQAALPRHHGDPFDRLLAAQAQFESMPVVSGDPVLDRYAITRVW